MKTPRMSEARRLLLVEFVDGRVHPGVEAYQPLRWALAQGYVEPSDDQRRLFRITESGRVALVAEYQRQDADRAALTQEPTP